MQRAPVAALLLVLVLASLFVGPATLSLADVGAVLSGQSQDVAAMVLFELRVPRTLLSVMTGAALAAGGVVMQSLFRNPLAEPGLVGVSAGAALGASLVLVVGWSGYLWLGLAGSFGAVLATWMAWSLARAWSSSAGLLLAGIAINALSFSVISLLVSLATDAQIRSITFWSLGSMTRVPLVAVLILLPWVAACLLMVHRSARALDAFLLGEREASTIGVPVKRVRLTMIAILAVLIGPLVALTGAISFVGLLVPQMLRPWVGSSHRTLLPMAVLVGACLVLLADMLCRVLVAPAELPIGVVISLAGAPLFLWVLQRRTGGISDS